MICGLAAGGHARARSVMYESEAPATFYQENDEKEQSANRVQKQRWRGNDSKAGAHPLYTSTHTNIIILLLALTYLRIRCIL